MGKFVFTNAYFAVDSSAGSLVDISDYVRSITLNYSRAEVDSTCMEDDGIARLAGLKDWSIDLEFAQDYASNKVDDTMWNSMHTTGTSLTVAFRPTTDAAAATNPEYRGEGWIFEYTPASGSPGDLGTASASIRAAAPTSALSSNWLNRITT